MEQDYLVDRDLALHSLHRRQAKLKTQLTAAWRQCDLRTVAALEKHTLMLAAEADLLEV